MSSPESVSSSIASVGSRIAIWKNLVALFFAAREPLVDRAVDELVSMSTIVALSLTSERKSNASSSDIPPCLRTSFSAFFKEVDVAHTRDLDRILECEKDSLARARIFGGQLEEVVPWYRTWPLVTLYRAVRRGRSPACSCLSRSGP